MDNCPKCNSQLEKDSNLIMDGWLRLHCPQCDFYHYIQTPQGKQDGSKTFIILYIFFAGVSALLRTLPIVTGSPVIFSNISAVFSIGAVVTIVTGFIKYPRNRAIKVLFWITIALIALSVLLVVLLIIACMVACNDCMDTCPG